MNIASWREARCQHEENRASAQGSRKKFEIAATDDYICRIRFRTEQVMGIMKRPSLGSTQLQRMRTCTGFAQKLPKGGGSSSSSNNSTNNEFPRCGKQLAPELARGMVGRSWGWWGLGRRLEQWNRSAVVTFHTNKGFSKKLLQQQA